jgi:hypothetical protein
VATDTVDFKGGNDMDPNLTRIEAKLDKVADALADIGQRIVRVEVETARFQALETRVAACESKQSETGGGVAAIRYIGPILLGLASGAGGAAIYSPPSSAAIHEHGANTTTAAPQPPPPPNTSMISVPD